MYIKDLKSSNGTFVNNERLSPEGVESEPFEIKSEDIVVGLSLVKLSNRNSESISWPRTIGPSFITKLQVKSTAYLEQTTQLSVPGKSTKSVKLILAESWFITSHTTLVLQELPIHDLQDMRPEGPSWHLEASRMDSALITFSTSSRQVTLPTYHS